MLLVFTLLALQFASSPPVLAFDLSDGKKSQNMEDRRGGYDTESLFEKGGWFRKASKEIQSLASSAEKGIPFYPQCPGDQMVAQLKEKLVALKPGLAAQQEKLDKFTSRSLDEDLSYDSAAISAQADSCKGSFRSVKRTLADRKKRLEALRRQLDEAVAPQDRQNAAEAYKMAQALAARCPDMPRDYTAFVIDSSTEGELRAYVKSYIYFHEYFESRKIGRAHV